MHILSQLNLPRQMRSDSSMGTHLKLLLVISLLVACGLSTYSYKNSLSFYPTPVKMALAPTPISSRNGNTYDMALGYSNGELRLTSTSSSSSTYDYYYNSTSSNMTFIDWNEAGVCVGSINEVRIIDPLTMTSKLYFSFSTGRPILSAACGYRTQQQPPTLIVVVAFSNSIQTYEGSSLVYNRSLTFLFQSMAMDRTAKYLYYSEGSTRYTLDLWNRRVFSQYSTSYPLNSLASAKSTGHYDISAGISSSSLTLWDDYYLLTSYSQSSFFSNFSNLAFTEDDSYLVLIDGGRYMLTLWRTNFNYYSSWSSAQEFSISSSSINSLDCQNGMIAYLNYNYLYIYQNDDGGSSSTLIIIIVCSVVGFILCVAIISFFVRKRRIQQQQINGGYNTLDNQTGSQGFNNNTQGWNNNPNPPTSWNNPNPQNTWNNNPTWNNQNQQNTWGNNQGNTWNSNQNQGANWSNQNQGFGSQK